MTIRSLYFYLVNNVFTLIVRIFDQMLHNANFEYFYNLALFDYLAIEDTFYMFSCIFMPLCKYPN